MIATVSSSDKAVKAIAIGADKVINTFERPFKEQIKEIFAHQGKRGVDVVLDHTGASTFSESFRVLDWGGRMVICGATTGSEVSIDLKPLFFKNISIHGSTLGSKSDLQKAVWLVETGKIKSVVDSVFSIKDLPKAFEKLRDRKVFGKIVIKT